MLTVLRKFPVVLTSQRDWDYKALIMRPGRVIFLPEDAVLISTDDYPDTTEKASEK